MLIKISVMKKKLLFGFLVLFVLSTAAFAGGTNPKRESDKSPATNPKENKLSDEEISRLNRRIEGKYNLDNTDLLNKGTNNLNKNLKATRQIEVSTRHHHGGYILVGTGGLILIIILIIVLV
jgi:hypothetical protein